MKPPIQAVIFDFGNVISQVDSGPFLAALGRLSGLTPGEVHERVFLGSPLSEDYESGRINSMEFREAVSELCGTALAEEDLLIAFTEVFRPIESTQALIRHLKPHYRLGLLSNTNPWHFERGIRTSPVFPLFDTVTLSYEVGAMKPDPRIYWDALAKLGLPPEVCVFIDDRPEFTAAAETLGLQGIPYTGEADLLLALGALGLEGLQ